MKNFELKKKVILFSILGILFLIGTSYAIWQLNFTQESSNTLSVACFSVTYSEQDNISLLNTYPMLDSEGSTLTPYQVTIKNNCNEYGAYQVNLEVLNTTTLDSGMVKVMFDDGTPKLLTDYTVVEKTLSNATTAYKMTTGFLHPNEERTFTLRLWIDESVTLEDQVEGKRFSSKITIVNTYKASAPTSQEECEAQYGEGASICNFIAQADPNNEKCLKVDENGMILDPYSTMSDSDTPIICTMEDDYGTSYYLRGNHQDNNVKFANMCWKMVRITGTGGIKMIYNGDLDANGKCTKTSVNHTGFKGQTLPLSGNKIYGSSYTKSGSTYTLSDTSTLNWPNDSSSIIGKYTCGNTNSTCSTLYAVTGDYPYVVKLDQSTNYAQIGTSAFYVSSGSPAYVGYMFNGYYTIHYPGRYTLGETIVQTGNAANTSNYYYGDTISYNTQDGYYYITNGDNSNVVQLAWSSNYETNLVGKYTCKETSKYNNKTIRCQTAHKVLDTITKPNYMITEYLSGGRVAIGNIKLALNYSENNGTYELVSPITISALDWYNGYSNYNNYYYCKDWNQTTCSDLRKISSSTKASFGTTYELANNYYYGSSFTYDETNLSRPYTLTNTIQFWDFSDDANITSLNTHHYTCFYATDNTCDKLYFIYKVTGSNTLSYIILQGNETISDALDKMLRTDNANSNDSHVKGVIDWWYETNIEGTTYENYLEDTVFCNDRTIDSIGGWSETGNINNNTNSYLRFNASNDKYYLKCPNKNDAFTVNDETNGNGKLTYPVGLLTTTESNLVGNANFRKTGSSYLLSGPYYFGSYSDAVGSTVYTDGSIKAKNISENYGVRPVISLKPGTKFVTGGDGTAANPYEVE